MRRRNIQNGKGLGVLDASAVGTEPAPCRERAFELELPPIELAGVLEPFDIFAAIGVNDGQFVAGSFIRRTGFAPDELTAALEEKHHKRPNLLQELT